MQEPQTTANANAFWASWHSTTPAVRGNSLSAPCSSQQQQLVQPRASPQLWSTLSRERRLERSCDSSREGITWAAVPRHSPRVFLDTSSCSLRHAKPQPVQQLLPRFEPLAACALQVLSLPLAKAYVLISLLDVSNDCCGVCSAGN